MGFGTAVRTCLSKYVDWQGRASRAEYWWWLLAVWILVIPGIILSAAANAIAFLIVVFLAVFLPSLSVTIRRLHDTGRSGAWYWISLVPFAGGIVLLVFTLTPGDPGSNAFGPPS
jgi:uncharacterized membrane protein YhaH (DUF805 family)